MAKAIINFCLNSTDTKEVMFETEGIVKVVDNKTIIDFIEQTELKLHTKVIISSTKVVIERTGKVEMQLVCDYLKDDFVYMKIDKEYEISMINHTILLDVKDDNILVIYQTEMDKENNTTHQLKLSWKYI